MGFINNEVVPTVTTAAGFTAADFALGRAAGLLPGGVTGELIAVGAPLVGGLMLRKQFSGHLKNAATGVAVQGAVNLVRSVLGRMGV